MGHFSFVYRVVKFMYNVYSVMAIGVFDRPGESRFACRGETAARFDCTDASPFAAKKRRMHFVGGEGAAPQRPFGASSLDSTVRRKAHAIDNGTRLLFSRGLAFP